MGRVAFRLQKSSNAIYRVGPLVGGVPQAEYSSIQDAIDDAVADGHTDNSNPATIEIYPGTYTENLTLNSGVHLKGIKSENVNATEVVVVGTATYSPVSGTVITNILNISNLCLSQTTGKALVFGGTAAASLKLRRTVIEKPTGSDTDYAFENSNSNSGSSCRFTDCSMQLNVASATGMSLSGGGGTTEWYGGASGVSVPSGVTIASVADLSGSGILLIRCQSFCNLAATNIFNLNSTGSTVQAEKTNIQNSLAGGTIINFTAVNSIPVRFQWCRLLVANSASPVATGSVAGVLVLNQCSYAGNFTTPNSLVSDIISLNPIGIYGGQKCTQTGEFYVGRLTGYATIQAAITAAAADATTTRRKVVYIAPGNYSESLTLSPNVDLVADTKGFAYNGFTPVTITGVHSLNMNVASAAVNISNIRFQSLLVGATPLFSISGSQTGFIRFKDCFLNKSFAGTTSMFSLTNSVVINLSLSDCELQLSSNGGAMFNCSGASIGNNISVAGSLPEFGNRACIINTQTGPGAASIPFFLGNATAGSGVYVSNTKIEATSNRLFSLAHASDTLSVSNSEIRQAIDAGEVVYFGAAGAAVITNTSIEISGAGGTPGTVLVAEDGGSGGTFDYGSCAFSGNSDIKNTLTITQYAETLTPV